MTTPPPNPDKVRLPGNNHPSSEINPMLEIASFIDRRLGAFVVNGSPRLDIRSDVLGYIEQRMKDEGLCFETVIGALAVYDPLRFGCPDIALVKLAIDSWLVSHPGLSSPPRA